MFLVIFLGNFFNLGYFLFVWHFMYCKYMYLENMNIFLPIVKVLPL